MAFNMNGSPLNKLNLFRKGRGKDYRQTKRAIKRQIRKTGGFEATAGADGQFTVTGGSGAVGGDQSGRTRRQAAIGAAEQMTLGIDNKAAFAHCSSSSPVAPLTPIAPKSIPFFVLIGSPPGKATMFFECASPGTLPGLPSFP